jgi:hypothetical protein
LPDDDDDDEALKPNPLVKGRAKAVDLSASIRSTAQEQKKELAREPEEAPPMAPALDREEFEAAAPAALPTVADEYGELPDEESAGAPEAGKGSEKRAGKIRPKVRARGGGELGNEE